VIVFFVYFLTGIDIASCCGGEDVSPEKTEILDFVFFRGSLPAAGRLEFLTKSSDLEKFGMSSEP